MGSIYKRGEVYWVKYYRAGKPYRESSKSTKESDAKRLLRLREGQVAENRFAGLKVERIKFGELAEDLINDYKINNKKSLEKPFSKACGRWIFPLTRYVCASSTGRKRERKTARSTVSYPPLKGCLPLPAG